MQKLHKHLEENYNWYAEWHKNPKHHLTHWVSLLFISIIITAGLINTINYSIRAEAESIIIENLWLKTLNIGEDYPRDMIYANGYLYAFTQTVPAKIIKIDPINPANLQTLALPSDGKHNNGIQLTYVSSQNKIYAYFSAGSPSIPNYTPTHIYISQIDPNTLTFTDVIDDPDFSGNNGAITNDGINLYITTFGGGVPYPTAYSSVIKYRLSDFSRQGVMYLDASHSYGGNWGIPNSTWAITHDNGKLYISADGHDSQPAWVARLSADTMNFEQFIWTSVVASEQGHRMVVVGDYLWSAIRPGKFLRVLKSDLNNFSEISTGMETAGEWTRAGVYAGGGYVWTCNSGSPSLLAQIEPNTLEVRTYNFPIGQGLCQSIQGDSQNLYFAFYQSPGKVSAVSLSSLINTTDSVPPTTPTNLTATTTTSSQINLSWTASTDNVGVTGYKVYRKTGTNPFTQIASTTITNYQDTTLTAETTYSYTVSAYDLAGNNSPQSLAVSASTLVPPPPPVISIGSRIQTTDRVKVRTTPTTKGKALCTQPLGVLGTVVGGPTTASGYKWWNVNYDSSCDGWSVENYIKPL